MTVDEELNRLEDDLRRLKIEYEAYFNGAQPHPPNDLAFRVERTIKKYGAGMVEMSFRQRFRFSQLTQSYAVHSDLWRKKLRMKEEGTDATPMRHRVHAEGMELFSVVWSDPDSEHDKVELLLEAVARAKAAAGEPVDRMEPQIFAKFIREKTRQLQQSLECSEIQFTVRVEEGRVKLRAAKATAPDE